MVPTRGQDHFGLWRPRKGQEHRGWRAGRAVVKVERSGPSGHRVADPQDEGAVRRANGTVVRLWMCGSCGERALKSKAGSWSHMGVRGPRGAYAKGADTSDLRWPYGATVDPLVARINEAVPRTLPEQIREEACQELAVALLTGEPLTDEVIKAALRAARFGYQFSSRTEWSMDEPAPGQRTQTPLRDLLASSSVVDIASVASEADEALWDLSA